MSLEIFKVVAIAIIAFGLGSSFVDGRQTLEVSNLNKRVNQLEKQLSQRDKQLANAQAKAQKQHQMIEEFYKKWKQEKN